MKIPRWLRDNGLYLGSVGTFVSGMVAAAMVYITAEDAPDLSLEYDPENSKKYLRALETYGGKANVMASHFMRWFESLWHGKKLAFSIAIISILISLVLFYLDRLLNTQDDCDRADHRKGGF